LWREKVAGRKVQRRDGSAERRFSGETVQRKEGSAERGLNREEFVGRGREVCGQRRLRGEKIVGFQGD
jgi:hypothetical protein